MMKSSGKIKPSTLLFLRISGNYRIISKNLIALGWERKWRVKKKLTLKLWPWTWKRYKKLSTKPSLTLINTLLTSIAIRSLTRLSSWNFITCSLSNSITPISGKSFFSNAWSFVSGWRIHPPKPPLTSISSKKTSLSLSSPTPSKNSKGTARRMKLISMRISSTFNKMN